MHRFGPKKKRSGPTALPRGRLTPLRRAMLKECRRASIAATLPFRFGPDNTSLAQSLTAPARKPSGPVRRASGHGRSPSLQPLIRVNPAWHAVSLARLFSRVRYGQVAIGGAYSFSD